MTQGTTLASAGWSIDLAHKGVLAAEDRVALRLSQPLRVAHGGLSLLLPEAWDYATQAATQGVRRLSLAPAGREVQAELAWSGTLWGGAASASLFHRRDPGHRADLPDDAGLALRWSRGF